MLEVASVVGLEFCAAAMTDALEKTVEEIEGACETLSTGDQFIESDSLLTWPDGTLTGRYRFQHHLYLEVIYRQIAEARRARIHGKVGKRLEAGYGERVPEIAAILASHFESGNDLDRAQRYRRLSAEQALERHAYLIAIDELGSALEKLEQMAESIERSQQQLDCLILLGTTLTTVQGYSSPEVEQSFGRALEMCAILPGSEKKFNALWNLASFHMSRGELAQSRRLIEQAVELANESDNPDLRLLADAVLAQHFWAMGDYKNASEQAARVLTHYDSARHSKFARTYSQEDPAQVCAGLDVVASLVLGNFSQSLARERLVHELSAELNNPHSTGIGLAYCAVASQIRRDPLATQKYADELIEISNRYDLHWVSFAMAMKGWATAKQAPGIGNLEMIENCLASCRQGGMKILIPYCLGLLAETQRELGQIREAQASIAEALSLVAQTQVGWNKCQLYRLQGELLLQLGADQQDAEQSLMKSMEIARNRQNLLLELHGAVSLSQLWIEQGRTMEVPALLQPIIARFDEDSDDSDLDQARKLVAVNC
jgi:tetratricopeptide (TPR) repeat protein